MNCILLGLISISFNTQLPSIFSIMIVNLYFGINGLINEGNNKNLTKIRKSEKKSSYYTATGQDTNSNVQRMSAVQTY